MCILKWSFFGVTFSQAILISSEDCCEMRNREWCMPPHQSFCRKVCVLNCIKQRNLMFWWAILILDPTCWDGIIACMCTHAHTETHFLKLRHFEAFFFRLWCFDWDYFCLTLILQLPEGVSVSCHFLQFVLIFPLCCIFSFRLCSGTTLIDSHTTSYRKWWIHLYLGFMSFILEEEHLLSLVHGWVYLSFVLSPLLFFLMTLG